LVKLWRFLQAAGQEAVLGACLPLPAPYVDHIATEEVREEVSSAVWRTMSLRDRAEAFASLARRLLDGEAFELSVLWIEVKIYKFDV
jgi:hypothetical protein